ncbi:methylated-DNA--[protein]-cysteine S-methyltransferase [Shewanella avicenniae]|uniref:methylated-DNA--[protein]-cysteine S-methyltransferase n=1 Tax=Shewanella avicenniae TaxID=2814294 RepID=UPI001E5B290D|nr:methylated-DNA--[protein]-cysteine S-methyltransferase [Shewanella avicenniae]
MNKSLLKLGANPAAIACLSMPTPVGEIWMTASELGLCSLRPLAPESLTQTHANVSLATQWLEMAAAEVDAYFSGNCQRFTVPLAPQGTAFQQAVWQQLLNVPFGHTSTYGELAANMGKPSAARAVGAANGANKIAIIIPCHRVIGKQGSLTGYAWGIAMKQQLLQLEGIYASNLCR